MKKLEVFCLDDTESREIDSIHRGFRGDIYVKVKEEYFNLNFYDIIRLKQDFETEIEVYGVFSSEPNMIIVEEVKKELIIRSIKNLFKRKYFDQIKPLSNAKLQNLELFLFSK
ncbi:hypothetical protein [Aquimarina megaterium]|uniref:hypothetical protein n=1 Tax=Aquimarina megaterium TaxID=1443666 RepID=UPI00046F1CF4|nr:hypothetical protein [Aquimarina megaterium]